MTFKNLQDRLMARLRETSTTARSRIKDELNDRYREVATAINLDMVRRGSATFTTASGNSFVTQSGIAQVIDVYDPTYYLRTLNEISVTQQREMDAGTIVKAHPWAFARYTIKNDLVTLRLYPQPISAETLDADCILAGVDMVADADEPAFATDFHDILIHGVLEDEYRGMEKYSDAAIAEQAKFEKRLGELRYFLAKSAFLVRRQQDRYMKFGLSSRVWPYANLGT